MRKYQVVDIVLIAIAGLFIVYNYGDWKVIGIICGILLFVSLGLKAGGAFDIRWSYFTPAIYKGNGANERTLYLTFDDGPTPITTQFLEYLHQENIKATFFCIGKQIAQYPDILKATKSAGHLIGNHTYNHSNKNGFLNKTQMLNELILCNRIIQQTVGIEPTIFRPPFGVTNPTISRAVQQLQLKVIGWNIRSLDTITADPTIIAQRVIQKLKPGSIILMHDTTEKSLMALKMIIIAARKQEYQFGMIDEIV